MARNPTVGDKVRYVLSEGQEEYGLTGKTGRVVSARLGENSSLLLSIEWDDKSISSYITRQEFFGRRFEIVDCTVCEND